MDRPPGGQGCAEVAAHPFYHQLLKHACVHQPADAMLLGQVWTACRTADGSLGLAMSPSQASRVLPWAGTLRGRLLSELATWLTSWNVHEASVGMAALNASLLVNHRQAGLDLIDVPGTGQANLAVFEWFLPQLQGCRVVIIGRYPGLQHFVDEHGWQVLERVPETGDWPDPACEYLLPQADWVFLTATSIVNKTFPRLAALASSARLVLVGPTAPWLPELSHVGVDYIAGVKVHDPERLWQTMQEGGGAGIFDNGACYCVAELTPVSRGIGSTGPLSMRSGACR